MLLVGPDASLDINCPAAVFDYVKTMERGPVRRHLAAVSDMILRLLPQHQPKLSLSFSETLSNHPDSLLRNGSLQELRFEIVL